VVNYGPAKITEAMKKANAELLRTLARQDNRPKGQEEGE
jgi:hypothetical protein